MQNQFKVNYRNETKMMARAIQRFRMWRLSRDCSYQCAAGWA